MVTVAWSPYLVPSSALSMTLCLIDKALVGNIINTSLVRLLWDTLILFLGIVIFPKCPVNAISANILGTDTRTSSGTSLFCAFLDVASFEDLCGFNGFILDAWVVGYPATMLILLTCVGSVCLWYMVVGLSILVSEIRFLLCNWSGWWFS